ncbi:hypothetical protein PT974_07941 [Cladobotryum mycophilum]|uniref:Copper acquisition factor BIM1-like domain-containing protein n=1 Tax=Cladobotryum mycophilum TaxID=491253 RepID=A0ABR0SCX0_9HYPO
MRSSSLFLSLSALTTLASAHFLVNTPPSIGFDDNKEGTAPCGGFTPNLQDTGKLVDFHVGGDAISVKLTHNQGNWLFRVTQDPKAASGWEQIFPIVMQSGLGDYCVPHVTVPDSYVGKKGIIGIVSNAPDGLLYQCITANFVEGVNSQTPSACKNGTIKASFVNDSQLSALVGASSGGSGGNSTSAPSSPTGSKPSASTPSPTKNAAASLQGAWSTTGAGFGNIVAILSMALVGGALLV